MTFSIYEDSVPVFRQMLGSLSSLLHKAEAHAKANCMDVNELLEASLAPDMFSFTRQIQIACDHAKGCAARLAGVDNPKFEDTEKTVAELQERIRKTLEIVNSVKPDQFAGAEDRDIQLVFPWATYDFKGSRYLTYWALPNFFFHATTAYDLLRYKGVPVGKADFLGQ